MDDLQAQLKGTLVSRVRVLEAIREFASEADERDWLANEQQLYVLVYDGQPFPPKRILSIATGLPVRGFHGGDETNSVLRALGFDVIAKSGFLRAGHA
jgi:5-methylcytosine-specific restriction protein B